MRIDAFSQGCFLQRYMIQHKLNYSTKLNYLNQTTTQIKFDVQSSSLFLLFLKKGAEQTFFGAVFSLTSPLSLQSGIIEP